MMNKLSYKAHVLLLKCVIATAAFGLSLIAQAATLQVNPSTGVYTTGSTFTTAIRVNTSGQPINAAEGSLSFDPSKLQVTGISKGSIFNLWTVEPTFSNSAGTITFGGGSPTGYTGAAGTIINVQFRALTAGTANLSFTSGSVLAADGRGTNVLSNMGSGAFTLAANEVPAEPEVIEYVAPPNTPAAPVIKSATHSDPAAWSRNTTAQLSWSLPTGITAVRTLLDANPGSIPTKVYENPIDSITLEELDEGISYFHLQFRNAEGWGRVAHYRLAVDTTDPSSFDIKLPDGADLSAPEQTLQLVVEDNGSGVERYSVQVDGGEPFEYVDETGSSTIKLPALEPGKHSVIIEAIDYAGNSIISTFSFTILAFNKPQFTEYPSQINSEVIPVIFGVTRPEADVTITVRRVSEDVGVQYTVVSDASGLFSFIPDARLDTGVYELSAVAVDQHGAKSEASDTIRIAVQDPGYIMIGTLLVSILSIIVPLIALLLLLFLVVAFFARRVRVISSTVRDETNEALQVLDNTFDSLETSLDMKSDELRHSRKTKKLTKAEADLVKSLGDQLKKARTQVRKEVAEVDDIVE